MFQILKSTGISPILTRQRQVFVDNEGVPVPNIFDNHGMAIPILPYTKTLSHLTAFADFREIRRNRISGS
uniref:Uncharacterized protein n=1 Tax=Angiostrongylus cantonensis TaxID=6313 RepID=A0A158PAI1_ANGCA